MTNAAIVIRTNKIDAASSLLERRLQEAFGRHVYFAVERFSDVEAIDLTFDGKKIEFGARFLERNNLRSFPRAGWQCGDYCLYAAIEALTGYDFLWLVEPDVSFTDLPIAEFFDNFALEHQDLIAVRAGQVWSAWMWYAPMANYGANVVYSMPFPFLRVSKSSIEFLRGERARYSSRFSSRTDEWNAKDFANDEAFVATTLLGNGATHLCMRDAMPKTFERFSTNLPILPEELCLPHLSNQVVHPVCDPRRAFRKFRNVMKKNPRAVKVRMEEVCKTVGEDVWRKYTGIDPSDFDEII